MTTTPKPVPTVDMQQLLLGVSSMIETMKTFADGARGYKLYLEAQGWSPTAAEQAALHYLMQCQAQVIGGGGKDK